MLRQIDRAEQLEVAKAVGVSVQFKGAVQRAGCIVTVKELQIRVGRETQVHVRARGIVHCGGGSVREAVKRVVIKKVPGQVCVLVKVTGERSPACIVRECADCQCSCTVSRRVAVLLPQWFPNRYVPLLAAGGGVVIVADAAGGRRPPVRLAEILTHTQTCVRVGGGVRRLRHVTAAAVLLHHQPSRNEMEGWSRRHGESKTILLHAELKGARLVAHTAHRRGLILLLKLLKVLWKSRLVLLAPRLILQPLLQFQSHGGVDVVGLHTSWVELRATLGVSTAILRAATWEA